MSLLQKNTTLLAFATVLFAACIAEDGPRPIDTADSGVLIKPTASVYTPPKTRADFTGPVNGTTFIPMSEKIFGVTAYIDTQVPTSWVATSRINNASVNSDKNGAYYFDENKFYPREGQLYFYAFSPMVNCAYTGGTETTHPIVTYNITGREDILWAKNESGIGVSTGATSQDQPDFQFEHKLQRVIFSVRRTVGVPNGTTISEIRISGLRTIATLDIIDGTILFSEDPRHTTLSVSCDVPLTGDYFIVPYDLMFEAGIKEFDLTVVMNDTEYSSHVIMNDENAGKAGYKHSVRITMDGASLILEEPQIEDWESFETNGTI